MDIIIFLFLFFLILAALGGGLFALIWFILAPRNIFWTFVLEGTAKAIMKGGQFHKFLISWEGHTFDGDWNVIKGDDGWHPFGGLRWVGFWPFYAVYWYQFKWQTIDSLGGLKIHEEGWQDYVFLKEDVYYSKMIGVEDKNLLPLDVESIKTMAVINPYKAFFSVENWLKAVDQKTEPAQRDMIGEFSFGGMIEEDPKAKSLSQKEKISLAIVERKPRKVRKDLELDKIFMNILAKRKFLRYFVDNYGIKVSFVQIKSLTPPKDYLTSILKKDNALREKEVDIIRSEGEKKRIDNVYETIEKHGEVGKLIRTLEALEKSPLPASLVAQNISLPGIDLKGALRNIVYGKDSGASEDQKQKSKEDDNKKEAV
ncbi:MAG: SPFH domain-containing protein [Candidatus Paceibacterota bacterium]